MNELIENKIYRLLRWTGIVLVVCTYLLIVLGSTVRVTDSGTGCPGWPLCYNQIGPVLDHPHAMIEQSHRYLASIVTVLVFVCWYFAFKLRKLEHTKSMFLFANLNVLMIIVQVVLGAITVVTNNAPITVALHLIVGLSFLALCVMFLLSVLYGNYKSNVSKKLDVVGWLLIVSFEILLISGSIVVDGGAAKSCPSWPFCTTKAPLKYVSLQYIHRSVVLAVGLFMVMFFLYAFNQLESKPWFKKFALISVGCFLLTALGGALSAITKANEGFQDIHLGLATLTWLSVVATVVRTHFDSSLEEPHVIESNDMSRIS